MARANGRTNGRMDEGVPRGPRGPKNIVWRDNLCSQKVAQPPVEAGQVLGGENRATWKKNEKCSTQSMKSVFLTTHQ